MKWFDGFLQSFEAGEYHGLACRVKPWQYKGIMKTAEDNKWRMLSQKQVDVFLRNMPIEHSVWADFGHYDNADSKVDIRVSTQTGFVSIYIS